MSNNKKKIQNKKVKSSVNSTELYGCDFNSLKTYLLNFEKNRELQLACKYAGIEVKDVGPTLSFTLNISIEIL